jgi:predicted membrane-bound spermidine synthase
MRGASASRISLLVLFTISGFAGLIYESIWSHYLKLFLGHAAYAQTLVLVIFMGGMAAGAWWVGQRSQRLRNLLLGYAIVEGVIGLFALLFHVVFRGASAWAFDSVIPALESPALIGAFKWTLGALLILPQSMLLGTTFPLMSGAIVRRSPERSGQTLALLYFTNSLGAAIGVLASGFVLVGKVGLPGTIMTAGLLNVLLALVVWGIAKQENNALPAPASAPDVQDGGTSRFERIILAGAFATGAAAFMYEIAWIRMLALVLGSSTHAFELMLSAFILGIALGGFWVRNRIQDLAYPLRFIGTVMLAMATVALLTLYFYNASFDWMAAIVSMFTPTDAGFAGFHLGSHAIALVLMVPTTFFCGMTLPIMTNTLVLGGAGERAIGAVYAWNTLGAIAGIVLAVHLLMPLLGVKGLMIAGAAVHAGFGLFYLTRERRAGRPLARFALPVIAGLAFVAAIFFIQLDPRRMTSGVFRHGFAEQLDAATVVFFEHGKTASISLVEGEGAVTIATNGKPDAAIQMRPDSPALDDEYTMVAAAALPLSMHPAPKRIANIGIGSGLTSHALLADPRVEVLDSIEIEPVMAKAARLGFMPRVRNTFEDPRSHLHFEDAKTFFAAGKQRYDVIVSEPSNPWVSGVASLFSDEFYGQLVRYLEPDGLLVQWLQIYETDADTITSVLRALAPHFSAFALYKADDTNVLIVATPQGEVPRPTDGVFQIPSLREELARVQITSLRDIEARFLGNRALLLPALQLSTVPANSDYFPFVDQHAIRARVLKRNAMEITATATDPTAMLDLLLGRPAPVLPPVVRDNRHSEFDRLSRQATAMFESILNPDLDELAPQGLREVELLSASATQCARPGLQRAWLDSVFGVARTTTPALGADQLRQLWQVINGKPCAARLGKDGTKWLAFLHAVALRDGAEVATLGRELLEGSFVFDSQAQLAYAAQATISAALAQGDAHTARNLLQRYAGDLTASGLPDWPLKLLQGQVAAALAAHP